MNKAALRSQFKALLNRNDCSNALADTFIDQALGRIQRTLRVPDMEKASTITFTEDSPASFTLPTDFLEFIDLYYEDAVTSVKLTQLPMGRFLEAPMNTGAPPNSYTRFNTEVRVKPMPPQGSTLALHYYAKIPTFVDDSGSNWLSTVAPELLTYGALSFSADYFVDDRKQAFEDVYMRTLNELIDQARSLEFSGGQMSIQPMYNVEY